MTKFTTANQKVSLTYTTSVSDDYILVIDNYDKWKQLSAKVSFSLVLLRNNYNVVLEPEPPLCDYPHHVYPPPPTGDPPDNNTVI